MRLAHRLHVLQVHVPDVLAELLDRTHRVVALGRPPARVDGRGERPLPSLDLREHLVRRLLRMVLDRERDAVLAQDGDELAKVAGRARADDGRPDGGRQLAGPLHRARVDPRGVGRDVRPCFASSSCAISTCSAVAQFGWRCAPQRSIVSKPSAIGSRRAARRAGPRRCRAGGRMHSSRRRHDPSRASPSPSHGRRSSR